MASYRDQVLADGAVAYWRLGETSGTTAASEVGTFPGTISGGVTLNQPGALADGNPAMAFNGTTGNVTITGLNIPTAIWSVEGWIKCAPAPSDGYFVRSTTGYTWFIGTDPTGRVYMYNGTSFVVDAVNRSNNQWHHLVFTRDGTTGRIFVDGVETAAAAFAALAANPGVMIGDKVPGLIDDVAIYHTALTPQQIADHYAARLLLPPSPLPPPARLYPTYVMIAGVPATPLVRIANLTITDLLNEQPNTAALTVSRIPHLLPSPSFAPGAFSAVAFVTSPTSITYPSIQRGQPIEIYSGGLSSDQLVFGGEILTVQQYYELDRSDRDSHVAYHLVCTDQTRALNRRKVTKSYLTQSASLIAQDLIASFTSGFSPSGIAPNLPSVAIDFTFEEMNRALTRLANRVGAYWYVDYDRTVHFFQTDPSARPDPLVPGARFADLSFETDLSQIRTRVIVEGAGTTVISRINLGETMIPVRDPVMFPATGGTVRIEQARITYTGLITGGAGSLVGPGAQPGAAPTAQAIAGAGIEDGVHQYAVTWTSATGESLPSPIATVTVGHVDPPLAGPNPQAPTSGSGPNPGAHYYAVSYITATGETLPSPVSAVVTTTQAGGVPAPPATAAALSQVVGNLVSRVSYRYVTTITTAGGESLPGSSQNEIVSLPPAGPGAVCNTIYPTTGGSLAPGTYQYLLAFAVGETYYTAAEAYPVNFGITLAAGQTAVVLQWVNSSSDARVTSRKLYRTKANAPGTFYLVATLAGNAPNETFVDTVADATLGAARPSPGTPSGPEPGNQARVTLPTSADPRAVGRKIYRSDNGAAFRFLAAVANLTATEHLDNVASVASQPDAPTVDTTGGALTCVVGLTGIPIGPASVTGRRLYRTAANVSPALLQLLVTIANNTATTYVDTITDVGLGASAPTTNTTTAQRVALANLAIGGAGVVARKLYRTAANAAVLKLLVTLADNVTTSYTDAASDATLGATAPIVDTSGLQQPQGQVNAGATVLPVAGTSAFLPAGGFAVVGNGEQVIRYTGVTATALTGIPASGPGALTSTVAYNASVTVAPALTGVPASGAGAIARALIAGQDVNLLTIRDDLAAQASLAAIEGGDGIIEHYIQDRRMSPSSASAAADAELQLFSAPEIRVSYTTRDAKTWSGQTIAINLPGPTNLVGEFLIQRVQLTQFDLPGTPPLRSVQASSTRFSFEDVLRRLELEVEA